MRHVFLRLALLVIGFAACSPESKDASPVRTEAAPSGVNDLDLDDLVDDPARWNEQQVRVSGRTENVSEDHRAFFLEGEDWLWPAKVLVVTRSPVLLGTRRLKDDEDIVVVGTLFEGDLPGLQRRLGRPLDPQIANRWKDKAIILAREVAIPMDGEHWTEPAAASQ